MLIIKTALVLIGLYFIFFQPYWFTIGCFVAALYMAVGEVEERKKDGRW